MADNLDLALIRLHKFFGGVDESRLDEYFDGGVFPSATVMDLAHGTKGTFSQNLEQLVFVPEPSTYFNLWR